MVEYMLHGYGGSPVKYAKALLQNIETGEIEGYLFSDHTKDIILTQKANDNELLKTVK